jgi:hypothetical protein
MSRSGPVTQDWEPVVVRKKLPNAAAKKDEKAVNAARRAGADIDISKKRKTPPDPPQPPTLHPSSRTKPKSFDALGRFGRARAVPATSSRLE